MPLQGLELTIVIILFALVAAIGFGAGRWRKTSETTLDDWALAGRGFRSWISWFVVGGDLYTAYTYVAVPALLFGSGAIGFYALPYVAIEYPLVYLIMIRLWSVCKTHGYVTSADFVRARFGSPTLALAVAITGIVATMPYIALNLLGIQAVLLTMGISGSWPLIIAFAVLAAFTYRSGVRAPAMISFIKDGLVYLVIAVAIFYIPAKLGGWAHIFDSYNAHIKSTPPGTANLLTGWVAGMVACVWTFYLTPNPVEHELHWGGTAFALSHLGLNTDVGIYIGFIGVVVNLVVCYAGTVLLKAIHAKDGADQTVAGDYFTDVAEQPQAEPVVTAGGLA